MSNKQPGYHIAEIPKGELGQTSKIQEELDELKDAIAQGSEIMMAIEMADLYGALEAFAEKQGYSMNDLRIFSFITKRAFINGKRK